MKKTLYRNTKDQFEEKKSIFIGRGFPIRSEDQAKEIIESIRKEEYQATHNCYCYSLDIGAGIKRYSDDGEPSGTAGIPMLEVLEKRGITDCLVIATRYFGGTLLGAGGLVRAYTRSCQIALDSGIIVEKKEARGVKLYADYSLLGRIDYFLREEGLKEIDRSYSGQVEISLLLEEDEREKVMDFYREISSGQGEYQDLGPYEISKSGDEILEYEFLGDEDVRS